MPTEHPPPPSIRRVPRRWIKRSMYSGVGLAILLGCYGFYSSQWPTYDSFSRAIDPACMVRYCDFTLFYYKQARVIRQSEEPASRRTPATPSSRARR